MVIDSGSWQQSTRLATMAMADVDACYRGEAKQSSSLQDSGLCDSLTATRN
jgi:hypothetical protein